MYGLVTRGIHCVSLNIYIKSIIHFSFFGYCKNLSSKLSFPKMILSLLGIEIEGDVGALLIFDYSKSKKERKG